MSDVDWFADYAQDVICRRCLIPGRGWKWNGVIRCEPCHRAVYGDDAVDDLIVSDQTCFGEWWTDELLDRVASRKDALA